MHCLIYKTSNLILIGYSDGKSISVFKYILLGKLSIVNANGKIEKTVEAHEGATLTIKWSNDATGFLSS